MAPYHGRQTMASENVFIDKNDHVNKEIVKLKQDVILRTGAYGQVCKALRGLHCAAKVFHPTLVNPKRPDERGWFEKECSLLRQIRHPNIIQSWGVHHDGATGRHIMLMGTSLDHLSEAHLPYSHGPSPFRDRDYLSYYMVFHDFALPTREIVHRNLSRNNAFIVPRERAKITDFGMSKLINPCKTPGTLWLGTPEYNVQNVLVDLLSKLNEMLESSKAHCDPSNQSTPIAAPIARNCVKVKYKEQPTAVQLCLCQTSLKTAAACSEGSIAKFHDHAMQQLQCQDVLCQDSVPLKLEVVSNSDEVYEFMSKCNEIHHITSSWEKHECSILTILHHVDNVLVAQNQSYVEVKLLPHFVEDICKKHSQPRDCLLQIFDVFLQQVEPGPTWKAIVAALVQVFYKHGPILPKKLQTNQLVTEKEQQQQQFMEKGKQETEYVEYVSKTKVIPRSRSNMSRLGAIHIFLRGQFGFQNVHIHTSKVLGRGAYGRVFQATLDNLPCTAKILHTLFFQYDDPASVNLAARFDQECHILKDLRHPNILQFLGVVQDPHKHGPILLTELMKEISEALAYLHCTQVLHCDLSSNNVLLSDSCRAKVTDFGMLKVVDANLQISHRKVTQCSGKPAYIPPEALHAKHHDSVKLDVFSFGVLTIQIIIRSFPAQTDAEMGKKDPSSLTGEVGFSVSEMERWKEDIEKVPSDHALLPIALQCLKFKDKGGPNAAQLCQSLEQPNAGETYTTTVMETQQATTPLEEKVTQLQEQNQQQQQQTTLHKNTQDTESLSKVEVCKKVIQKLFHRSEYILSIPNSVNTGFMSEPRETIEQLLTGTKNLSSPFRTFENQRSDNYVGNNQGFSFTGQKYVAITDKMVQLMSESETGNLLFTDISDYSTCSEHLLMSMELPHINCSVVQKYFMRACDGIYLKSDPKAKDSLIFHKHAIEVLDLTTQLHMDYKSTVIYKQETMPNRKLPSVPLEKGFHTELRDIAVPYTPPFDPHLILNSSTYSPYHKSPLWCWKGRLRTLSDSNIRYFLCKGKISSVEELDTKCHETVCHAVVSEFPHKRVLPLLCIMKSRAPNVFTQPDKKGNVPLHNAVQKGSVEIVKELVAACPAAMKIANCDGETPIDSALQSRHFPILEYLLNKVVEDDPKSHETIQLLQCLLVRAMKDRKIEYFPILLKLQFQYELTIDFDCADDNGHTAWFYLQQHPLLQKEVEMMLNRSKLDPAMKEALKGQLSMKEEKLFVGKAKATLFDAKSDKGLTVNPDELSLALSTGYSGVRENESTGPFDETQSSLVNNDIPDSGEIEIHSTVFGYVSESPQHETQTPFVTLENDQPTDVGNQSTQLSEGDLSASHEGNQSASTEENPSDSHLPGIKSEAEEMLADQSFDEVNEPPVLQVASARAAHTACSIMLPAVLPPSVFTSGTSTITIRPDSMPHDGISTLKEPALLPPNDFSSTPSNNDYDYKAKCLEVPENGPLPSKASNLCETDIQSTKLHQPELCPSGNTTLNIDGPTVPHSHIHRTQSLPRMPRDIVKVLYMYTFSSEEYEEDDEDDGDISMKKKKKKKRSSIARSSSFHFRPIGSGSSSGKSCGAESSSESLTCLASKSRRIRNSQQKSQRKRAKSQFINYRRPISESDTNKTHGHRLKVKRKKKKSPTGDMESATEDESGELAIPRSDSSVQCNTQLLSGKPLTPPLPMSSELIVEKMLLPRDLPRSQPPTEADKSNESADPPHPESQNKWKGCFAVCLPMPKKRTVCIPALRRNLCWSLTQLNMRSLKPLTQPSLTQWYVLSRTCSLTNRLDFKSTPIIPPNFSTLNVSLNLEEVPPKVNLDVVGGNVQRVISGKQNVTQMLYNYSQIVLNFYSCRTSTVKCTFLLKKRDKNIESLDPPHPEFAKGWKGCFGVCLSMPKKRTVCTISRRNLCQFLQQTNSLACEELTPIIYHNFSTANVLLKYLTEKITPIIPSTLLLLKLEEVVNLKIDMVGDSVQCVVSGKQKMISAIYCKMKRQSSYLQPRNMFSAFHLMLDVKVLPLSATHVFSRLGYDDVHQHNFSILTNSLACLGEKLTPFISTLNVLLKVLNLDMVESVQCVVSEKTSRKNKEEIDQLTSLNIHIEGLTPLVCKVLPQLLVSSAERNELPRQDYSNIPLQSISDGSETKGLPPSATCVPSKQKCDVTYQNNFSLWVKDFIHDYGFEKLRESVPDEFHFLLGLSPWKGEHVPKHVLRNILDMARCSRSGFPSYAIDNLNSLSAVVKDRHYCRRPLTRCSLTRGEKSKKSKKPKQASSQNMGTLSFSATNRPLEVIRSHLTTYSKCCPRHDIQNIVVVGTTCPASDAFGPKRKYSSIADLKDDTRHSLFNASTSFKECRDETLKHLSCPSQQVMSDRPMAAMMRDKRMEPMHATGTISSDQHRLVAREPVVSLQGPVNQKHHGHTSSGIHSVCPIAPHSELTVEQAAALHASNDLNPMKRSLQLTSTARESIGRKDSKPEPDTLRSPEHTDPYMEQEKKGDTGAELLHRSRNVTEQSDLLRNVPANRQHAPQYSPNSSQQGEHKECTKMLAELLHAQDYPRILPLSYEGKPPMSLPPEVRIPYVFITALAYYKMSNHKKSVHHFQQCLQLAQECRRYGDITICNIYIGDIEFAQRKYIEAANKYRTALDNYDRDSVAKDFRMILPTKSAVWSKCGSAFKNASRMGDSVAAYEQAIEVATSMKDKLSAHTSLGNLYQGIGENGRAVKEYEDAIALATELKDNVSLGWNHGNLGNALLGLHQRDKALHHLFKALDMAVDYETTPQAIGRAYNNLGTAFQSLSEHEKAEEHYDLALGQAIYGNDIPGQARVYGNIGNLQMLKKHYDRAVPHYTEVMRLSQDKSTITTAHHNRGCAYYDWAEEKKNALIKKTSPTVSTGFKISLHGQTFEQCEEKYRPTRVPDSIQKYYLQGTRDLEYVIKHHEENFSGIKGSPKGLSLSVSLFETNSRTFHRMQDCLVHLKNGDNQPSRFEDALLFAEQSRARTLGELLLKRRGPQLQHQLVSPPSLSQLKSIVSRQPCPVLYLSYTGERLLGWVLFPTDDECSVNMFEVPLSDSEFDGKSFDYHLRYSLNEQLVERSFEMYKPFKHDKDKTDPVAKLYDLVARPLMVMLNELDDQKQSDDKELTEEAKNGVRKVIIIPDSYTNLLPFTCTLNRDTGKFWGDKYYFQIMPSLLTMGILDQLPAVSVTIPVQYQQMLCVVGNPTIPPFKYNNDEWNLGKLPHATKEAEWVSHILKCKPILHEQATKDAVMMRIMNAKVIHLATHGSAVAGFLAFAGMSASSNDTVDAKKVLIYPEEIESLNISPALVVLSSCDSGRGVFKADGIQGMARAFILAGAQAVLTTLWRVPDESACIFMQFFYQYLVEGVKGTEALHKAILCVRCFSKYSQYIHWSGYQLTGRELQFNVNQSSMHAELNARLGPSSIFPRLDIVKRLEEAYLNDPRLPTDVQVLCGPSGVKAFEPLIDFIHSNHHHFTGGVFWINCRTPQLVDASLKYIAHVLDVKEDLSDMPDSGVDQSLVVFDSPGSIIVEDSRLLNLIKNRNVHIVVVSKSFVFSDSLRKLINDRLLRGAITHDVQPLSTIHTTQRIVYSIMKKHSFAPSSSDQKTFEKLAEFTNGSPDIVDVVSSLLQLHFSEDDSILSFADRVGLDELGPSTKPPSMPHSDQFMASSMSGAVRHISQCVYDAIPTVQEYENAWTTSSHYDSWQAMTVLIEQCNLTSAERMLLNCLSVFSCSPIPALLITEIATMICKASHTPFLAPTLHKKLKNINFLKIYPKPVVCAPNKLQTGNDVDIYYVPKFIAEALWKDTMTDSDRAMALAVAYKALNGVYTQSPTSLEGIFLSGASSILVEQFELNFALIGKECYQELYRLFISNYQTSSANDK